MENFKNYLEGIKDKEKKARMEEVLRWIQKKHPELRTRIAWGQPMFTDHGTFIIGCSATKNHMTVTPEVAGIEAFKDRIKQAGYEHSKMTFSIPWNVPVDYNLLKDIIDYNKKDKEHTLTFWRK